MSDLLVGQVECADVLLVNKCDLVDGDDLAEVEDLLAALNPEARVVRTTLGEVDADAVLGTGLFDVDTVSETAAWQRAAEHAEGHHHAGLDDHDHEHQDPQSAYDVDSFVFRSRRPLHPERFAAFARDLPDAVVRSKGTVRVAGRDDTKLFFSQAGPSARVESDGRWMAAMEESRREMQRRMHPEVEWDDEVGDRRTELVVIGRGMDEDAVGAALEDCLLTDEERDLDPDSFENPFPTLDGEPVML
jgi:G3E family GTPase